MAKNNHLASSLRTSHSPSSKIHVHQVHQLLVRGVWDWHERRFAPEVSSVENSRMAWQPARDSEPHSTNLTSRQTSLPLVLPHSLNPPQLSSKRTTDTHSTARYALCAACRWHAMKYMQVP